MGPPQSNTQQSRWSIGVHAILFQFLVICNFATVQAMTVFPMALASPITIASGRVYFIQSVGSLTVLDLQSGHVIARVQPDGDGLNGEVVVDEKYVHIVGQSRLQRIDGRTFTLQERFDTVKTDVNARWITAITRSPTSSVTTNANLLIYDQLDAGSKTVSIGEIDEHQHVIHLAVRENLIIVARQSLQPPKVDVTVIDAESGEQISQGEFEFGSGSELFFGPDFLIEAEVTIAEYDWESGLDFMAGDMPSPTSDYWIRAYDSLSERKGLEVIKRPIPSGFSDANPVMLDGYFIDEYGSVSLINDENRERSLKSFDQRDEDEDESALVWRSILIPKASVTLFQASRIEPEGVSGLIFHTESDWARWLISHRSSMKPRIEQAAFDRPSDLLVIGSSDGRVECVDNSTGDSKWLYTFAYSYIVGSFNSRTVFPYFSTSERLHRQRHEDARQLSASQKLVRENSQMSWGDPAVERRENTVEHIHDPKPDLLHPKRIERMNAVWRSVWKSMGFVIVMFFFSGALLTVYSSSTWLHEVCVVLLVVVCALSSQAIGNCLWEHHRVDEAMTRGMKINFVLLILVIATIGFRWFAKTKATTSRRPVLFGLATISTAMLLLYVNWLPLLTP